MPIALSALIEMTREDNDLLTQILSSFSCEKDEDIEYFLHKRAVEFEKLDKARTYLICDEEQINTEGFCLDQLIIYGYIALALKVLSVPEETSTNTRKKLDGLSGKIVTSVEAVGGRYMMIECRDEKKLIDFYSGNGFTEINKMSDGEHIQVQMIRKI